MKTRQGFVSNSSSSSYVLVLKERDYDDILSESNAIVKSILSQLEVRDETFGDEKVKVVCWWEGNTSSFEWIKIDSKLLLRPDSGGVDKWDIIHECWEEFVDVAAKKGLRVENYDS